MAFSNPVVGGVTLIREAIQSPNYVAGVSGWTINRDGSAEFNDVDIRGSLTVTGDVQSSNFVAGVSGWRLRSDGTAEFNGAVNLTSTLTVAGAVQSSNFVSNVSGWQLSSNGNAQFNGSVSVGGALQSVNFVSDTSGWQFASTGNGQLNGSFSVAGSIQSANYDPINELGWILDPANELAEFWTTLATFLITTQDIEVSGVLTTLDPDLGAWLLTTGPDPEGLAIENWAWMGDFGQAVVSMADGKAPGSTAVTVINFGSDTNISGANAQDVPQIADHAYLALVSIDQFMTGGQAVGSTRLDYKLWDGTVGSSTQLGGTCRQPMTMTGTNRQNVTMRFLWRAAADDLIANMNLSAIRGVNGGTASVEVNAAYSVVVFDLGPADKVQNL